MQTSESASDTLRSEDSTLGSTKQTSSNNQVSSFPKGASMKEIVLLNNNPEFQSYKVDDHLMLLMYNDTDYLGTEAIDRSSYECTLTYYFEDDQLLAETYSMEATSKDLKSVEDYHSLLRSICNIYGAPESNNKLTEEDVQQVAEILDQADINQEAYVTIWQNDDYYVTLQMFCRNGTANIIIARLSDIEEFTNFAEGLAEN